MFKRKILGIITARGGSKRVPKKNIKNFLDKPLLAWSIETGQKSKTFDDFILSTDSEEIAEIGKKYGIDVPFLRPADLAQDNSSSLDAIKHAVNWFKNNENKEYDIIILLEPSSPGRQDFHIAEVAKIFDEKWNFIDSIVGISEMPPHFNPIKALKKDNQNLITNIEGKLIRDLTHINQDIPKNYYINSSIYAFKTKNIFDNIPSLWGEKTYGYIMEEKYSMDIDTTEDWELAKIKMNKLIGGRLC